jgi:hypothetical protein
MRHHGILSLMSMPHPLPSCLLALLALTATGCREQEPAEPAEPAPATRPMRSAEAAPGSAPVLPPSHPAIDQQRPPAGPQWKPSDDPKQARFLDFVAPKPATWIEHPPSGLGRVANYTVPGPSGGEAAHVVVSYFGATQGGDVEANIERWQYQFRPHADGTPQEPIVEEFETDGMPVTLVELAGDWMKMGQTWYTPDQLFLAAIVQTPEGKVFIRFTGEAATVEANREPFMQMLHDLHRADEDWGQSLNSE